MANRNQVLTPAPMFAAAEARPSFGGVIPGGDESHTLQGPIVYCPRCGSIDTEEIGKREIVVEGFTGYPGDVNEHYEVSSYRCRACGGMFALL